MEHFTDYQYLLIIILFILVGLFAGFSGAFFGVGGGTVLVPTLLAIYSYMGVSHVVDMHQTVAASLALVVVNTSTATYKYHKLGNFPWAYFKKWALWLFVGTVIGSIMMAYVSSNFLKILFTVYLFLAFIYQLLKKEKQKEFKKEQLPHGITQAIAGTLIGGLSLLLGLAGGPFSTPFFTFFDYPIKKAMVLSIAGGIVIGAVGTIAAIVNGWGVPGRFVWSLGYVNIITVLIIAPFVMLGSPWGVRIAARVPSHVLQRLYALFLLAIAGFMVYHLGTH